MGHVLSGHAMIVLTQQQYLGSSSINVQYKDLPKYWTIFNNRYSLRREYQISGLVLKSYITQEDLVRGYLFQQGCMQEVFLHNKLDGHKQDINKILQSKIIVQKFSTYIHCLILFLATIELIDASYLSFVLVHQHQLRASKPRQLISSKKLPFHHRMDCTKSNPLFCLFHATVP